MAQAQLVEIWNLQRGGIAAPLEVANADARLRRARAAFEAAQSEVKRLQEDPPGAQASGG